MPAVTAAPNAMNAIAAAVARRLGGKDLAPTAVVAAACNVSADTVRAWIEEGHIEAVNVGTGGRPQWQVLAASVVAFYVRRADGAVEKGALRGAPYSFKGRGR